MAAADEEPQATPPVLVAPLAGRIANLPIILAGPILRHVDSGSVTVWIALREAKQVQLQVFEAISGVTQFQSPQTSTLSLGTNLHVVAVTAAASSTSPKLIPGRLYKYNLQFVAMPGQTTAGGDL